MTDPTVRLADLTTLRVGGTAHTVVSPATPQELIEAVGELWASGEEVLLLGGGSNVLVGDDDFDGTVVRVVTRGIDRVSSTSMPDDADDATVRLRVQAGESWDALVAYTVANGWTGIEALSGIPGSCGAAPIQNIGAYGQELSSVLVSVEFLDYLTGEVERIPAADLDLGYRTSALKAGREGLVVSIELDLALGEPVALEASRGRHAIAVDEADDTSDPMPAMTALSAPVAYAQLAGALGVDLGQRVPIAALRETVLRLRASKGMVLDANDPDSVSAGSFFTNPIVTENFARALPEAAPRWPVDPEPETTVLPLGAVPTPAPAREYLVKLSAAWLIEHAGVGRGFTLPGSRAAVSSKHTLALTNRGGATAAEISELARYIQTRVMSEFGVRLHPEPVLVNTAL
ncbi:UDP-N-acetylmuramate dehydrogenase [Glaciihabitans sp. dw_435]|uniref:UDP-N-acetylmuramate dehydrogenase n=1 Tax=Glaciihabitans sp. dw_435 TaxID=2720081 RepID=UPI001BD6D7B6|nr:UDP-N-acetylmuramate dehydrogenase [Glaciihabitans sp. dw_435]